MSKSRHRREFVGDCARCSREVWFTLPRREIGDATYVRVRCGECGQINHLSRAPEADR